MTYTEFIFPCSASLNNNYALFREDSDVRSLGPPMVGTSHDLCQIYWFTYTFVSLKHGLGIFQISFEVNTLRIRSNVLFVYGGIWITGSRLRIWCRRGLC